MDKILNFLSNPLFGIILTVLFGVLAIILYYRSPPKVIKCQVSSNQLIDNTQARFSNLSILYGGKKVEKLMVSKVTFWNSSFSPIKKEDLIKKAPFSVMIEDGEILEFSVLEGEDTPNEINIDFVDNCSVKISFDYLNHKEGGIIQIIHTGNMGINISEKIMGGKIVKYNKKLVRLKILSCLMILISLLSIIIHICDFYGIFFKDINKEYYMFLYVFSFIIVIFSSFDLGEGFIPKNCKKKKKNK